jgi:hypothetical protein
MSRFDREREFLMRNPSQIREIEDRTDPADPIRGEMYSNTRYDVSVCWSRVPAWASHVDAGHCIRHGDVRLDDPDFVLIGDGWMGGAAVSQFSRGDRVYHRQLRRYGTYLDKHNWGEEETSSYVLFDGDDDYPDGRPVTMERLELAVERS